MTQNNKVWPAVSILMGVILVLSIIGWCQVANLSAEPTDLSGLEARLDKIELALQPVENESLDNNAILDALYADKQWRIDALELAQDELEERDYRELKKFVVEEFESEIFEGDTYRDLEDFKVVIRDSDLSGLDEFDKDATVEYNLKVYFEDKDGDRVKKYITAEVNIEDNEVEELDFEEA